jgi:hypothetical protein
MLILWEELCGFMESCIILDFFWVKKGLITYNLELNIMNSTAQILLYTELLWCQIGRLIVNE